MAFPPAFFHDRVLPYVDAKLGLLTHALNYGTGVFAQSAATSTGRGQLYVFRRPTTCGACTESARLLRMNLAPLEEATAAALLDLLRAKACPDCYIRALAFYTTESSAWAARPFNPVLAAWPCPSAFTSTRPRVRTVPSRPGAARRQTWFAAREITAATSKQRLSQERRRTGRVRRAILLNRDGRVTRARARNIFLIRRGIAVTPSLDQASWKASRAGRSSPAARRAGHGRRRASGGTR